jgi:hypothetical protein
LTVNGRLGFAMLCTSREKKEPIARDEQMKNDSCTKIGADGVDLLAKNSQRQLMPAGDRRRLSRFLRGCQADPVSQVSGPEDRNFSPRLIPLRMIRQDCTT